MLANAEILIEKIQALPPERLAEVDDFVDFLRLRERERSLTSMAAQASVPAFAQVWDNPDDEAYDAL
ncbi:MAG TPA: toxin-antitoxin system, antitoxin component, Xre family protein [Oxalobacteraceae bacterium]|nr:toxin-antitoxin system, antitoxin component, Xre family protein [Oxalobacteraceae bacterium]